MMRLLHGSFLNFQEDLFSWKFKENFDTADERILASINMEYASLPYVTWWLTVLLQGFNILCGRLAAQHFLNRFLSLYTNA
jgi:hypothetical protein